MGKQAGTFELTIDIPGMTFYRHGRSYVKEQSPSIVDNFLYVSVSLLVHSYSQYRGWDPAQGDHFFDLILRQVSSAAEETEQGGPT